MHGPTAEPERPRLDAPLCTNQLYLDLLALVRHQPRSAERNELIYCKCSDSETENWNVFVMISGTTAGSPRRTSWIRGCWQRFIRGQSARLPAVISTLEPHLRGAPRWGAGWPLWPPPHAPLNLLKHFYLKSFTKLEGSRVRFMIRDIFNIFRQVLE